MIACEVNQTEFITGEWGMEKWAVSKTEWVIGNITGSSADIWWFLLQENTPRNVQSETVRYQSGFKVGFLKMYVLNLFPAPPSVSFQVREELYIWFLLLSVCFWLSEDLILLNSPRVWKFNKLDLLEAHRRKV